MILTPIMSTEKTLRGGEFLLSGFFNETTFTPEDKTEEQQAFAQMARKFLEEHVWKNAEKIDKMEPGLTVELLNIAAELGLLGAAVPEQYGGLGIDFNTETVLTEQLGASGSFGVSLAAHTGIGTLPILYFGTEAQKQKYLPKLASGEWKASYCLTEPQAGTDSVGSSKSTATLSEDGKYFILNGTKMWITNAGFADVLTVFAKVYGKGYENIEKSKDRFTGFIVDAHTEGITLGAEENKLGIKGSSTRLVFFENVKVPVENMLDKVGGGDKIAFNVLNIGRYKLSLMVTGGAKLAAEKSRQYAFERYQFQQRIQEFGAIREKLANQYTKIYAVDSANYRTSGLIHNWIEQKKAEGLDPVKAKLNAADEFAIECSLLKVAGSEALDYVVDENVQIHGGMGYSEEGGLTPARAYRDSRINRIFEGTNEINRLLSVGMLVKRVMKGTLPEFMGKALKAGNRLAEIPEFDQAETNDIFANEKRALVDAKDALLILMGSAVKTLGFELEKHQEVVMRFSDIMIDIYLAESTLLRTIKIVANKGEQAAQLQINMTRLIFAESLDRIFKNGKDCINNFGKKDDEHRMILMGLERFTMYPAFNQFFSVIATRQAIANAIKIYE